MAAILSGRTAPGETIGARLRRLAGAARANNLFVNGPMASPPAVTTGSPAAPAGQTRLYPMNSPVFRHAGGVPSPTSYLPDLLYDYPVSTSGPVGTGGGNLSGEKNGTCWQVETVADAAKISWSVPDYDAAYRLWVEGPETGWRPQFVSLAGTTPTSGVADHITVDFGSRALRRIGLEGVGPMPFGGARVGATESLHPPGSERLRAVVLGDSYTFGPYPNYFDSWANVMGRALGIADLRCSGVGGTGWLARGASGTAYRLGERIAVDAVPHAPALGFIAGGLNDVVTGQSPTAIQAEVTARVREFRQALPSAPLFVFGVFPASTGPSTAAVAVETAISAGVAAAADPLTAFVPVSTDEAGAWVAGDGSAGAPNGSGNSDLYTSADAIHPTDAGHLFLGLRAADAVIGRLSRLP